MLLLKPGGTLLYSTCSLSPEENEMQVNWVLQTFDTIVLDTQVGVSIAVTRPPI